MILELSNEVLQINFAPQKTNQIAVQNSSASDGKVKEFECNDLEFFQFKIF